VRRAPLGADRSHRRYWWGLAGRRGLVLTEDADGCVGFVTAAAQLDEIAAVLDVRGAREAGLQAALEKVRRRAPGRPRPLTLKLPCVSCSAVVTQILALWAR
jgi:hypothetical protein